MRSPFIILFVAARLRSIVSFSIRRIGCDRPFPAVTTIVTNYPTWREAAESLQTVRTVKLCTPYAALHVG